MSPSGRNASAQGSESLFVAEAWDAYGGNKRLADRVRDVRQGPDGLPYVLTDQGAMLRLDPVQRSADGT